jgi:protein phosphatase 2C family protein 2/3
MVITGLIAHNHYIFSDSFYMVSGIWDCLSSQDVVDVVRYQVSEGKELTEIGEMICDHCLAPDTTSGAGIGCDNMTVLIVAITHGRSKEEWYTWIADRVKNNYGYETPKALPQLYAHSRLMAFRANKEIYDKHHRSLEEKYAAQRNASTSTQSAPSPTQPPSQNDSSPGTGQIRIIGPDELAEPKSNSNGPISHQAGGDIVDHTGQLMFVDTDTDSDDDDDFDVESSGRSYFSETLGFGRAQSPDPTIKLMHRLAEYEKEISDEHSNSLKDTGTDGGTEGENNSLIHCISSLFDAFFSLHLFFREKPTLKATQW